MCIAVWNNEDVPCVQWNRPVVTLDMCIAAALGQQVKYDHVLGVRRKTRIHCVRVDGAGGPGGGKLSVVKQGSVKFDGSEDFRQDIQAELSLQSRRFG
jgi:hypothetical protein